MRRSHFIFGIFLFVVFAITGRYMRVDFPDKDIIPQELRLLMRSRHIYILYCALMHILLGIYVQMRPGWRRWLQYSGSFSLFLSAVLLIWGFVAETYTYTHFSEISRFGIYASLAGTILHLLGGIDLHVDRKPNADV